MVMFPEFDEMLESLAKYAPRSEAAFPVSVIAPVFVFTLPARKYRPPAVLARVPPVIETAPPVDSTNACIVALALPLMVTSAAATIGPVGLTVVPPLMVNVPAEVKAPPPE